MYIILEWNGLLLNSVQFSSSSLHFISELGRRIRCNNDGMGMYDEGFLYKFAKVDVPT